MKYGQELMIQVPVGDGQTRQLTVKQAATAYRHPHEMRHMLKSVPTAVRKTTAKGRKHG